MLRAILHDWPDDFAIDILRHLRNASSVKGTKLIVGDNVLSHTCAENRFDHAMGDFSPECGTDNISLANLGKVSATAYLVDIGVSTLKGLVGNCWTKDENHYV